MLYLFQKVIFPIYIHNLTSLKTNKERKELIKAFAVHVINKDSIDKKYIFNICDSIFRAQSSLPQQSNTNSYSFQILLQELLKFV